MKKNYFLTLLLFVFLLPVVFAQTVNIGTGTSTTDNSPIQRATNYSASELLYLSSELNTTGNITGFGFYKASGSTSVTIDSVYIYMKTTSATALTTTSSTTGYTLVYQGPFPNNVSSGWVTVDLNMVSGFAYAPSAGNLSVLIVRPFQTLTTSRPYYRYTTYTGSAYNAWYKNDTAAWSGTMGGVPAWRPNARFIFSPIISCAVPTSLAATAVTSSSASLNWQHSGTPTGYQVRYGSSGFNVNTGGTTVYSATNSYSLNPPLNASTAYEAYVRAICGPGDTSAWSTPVTFTTPCNTGSIVATQDSSRCGSGSVTLSATGSAGSQLKWYAAATGGVSLGTGTNFNSPNISTTTTYYVEPSQLSNLGQAGRGTYTGIAQATPNNTGQGIQFNALSDLTIDSVGVWVVANSGSIIIRLQNAANTVLRTDTFSYNTTGASGTNRVKVYLPVDYSISLANNYKILALAGTTVSLSREQSVNPPFSTYNIPGVFTTVSSWVNGAINSANYYYFYDFYISSGCAGARQPVIATINSLPAVDLGADTTLCPGEVFTIDATTPNALYQWDVNNASTATVTVDQPGTYSVAVTVNNCTANDTIVINSGTVPVATLPSSVDICEGEFAVLNATNAGAVYLWTPGSETTATKTVNTAGLQTVQITSGDGCSIIDSTETIIRPNPQPSLIADSAICASSSIILDAGNPGYSYLWSTTDTTSTIQVSDTGTYSVLVTSPYGCELEELVHISNLPSAQVQGFNFIPYFNNELGKVKFLPIDAQDVSHVLWNFGDGTTSDDFSPEHTYSTEGDYAVSLIVYNECGSDTVNQMINVEIQGGTGIATVGLEESVNVFPNPASGRLYVKSLMTDLTFEKVSLINSVGISVLNEVHVDQAEMVVNLSGLNSGLYYLYIKTNKGILVKRIEVLH